MFKKIVALGCLLILAGCASTRNIPLSREGIVSLNNKVLQRSVYEKPDFFATTWGKASLGMIGMPAMIKAGNDIIKKNSVEDPGNYISGKIGAALANQVGLKVSDVKPSICKSEDINTLVATYKEADIILDIKTRSWEFMYFPTHWNQYRVMYLVHLRLIDRQSKKILAAGFYKYLPEYNKNAPSYDDLVGNGAQGLKRELRRAAECSIDFFKKETFNLQK